ncbi:GNAT family N-acetyltransferase [Falsihalocynthiibacter arcticus]|uniref:Acetyltransferase n=1 Tax=Falsihalocynthiibacter arcticus TaxID=1579316 RepID=A0A126UZA9_9RHOB|nr:GNAT family N-acetyltransferase [Falsihalocynthiibacter arcticus]AML51227.1 acetyltransferase [Falsihalocynthiibacter arcticus]
MKISVGIGDPKDPRTVALLTAHHSLMQSLFPAESNHFLSVDALSVPEITFLVASEGAQHLGCGALANKGSYGEIKSMFVSEAARGKGVANLILTELISNARASGLSKLYLETGDSLRAAHALYEKHGFTFCGPFGDYPDDPLSYFMELTL